MTSVGCISSGFAERNWGCGRDHVRVHLPQRPLRLARPRIKTRMPALRGVSSVSLFVILQTLALTFLALVALT
jgi:hypothetical protein